MGLFSKKPEEMKDTRQATYALIQKQSGHSSMVPHGSPVFDDLVRGVGNPEKRDNARDALISAYNRAFSTNDMSSFYRTLAQINPDFYLYKNDAFAEIFNKKGIKVSSKVITKETDFTGLVEKLETLTAINAAVQKGTIAVNEALAMYSAISYSERLFKTTKPQREYLSSVREAFSLDSMKKDLSGHELFGHVYTNLDELYKGAFESLGIKISEAEEPAEGAEDTRELSPEMEQVVKLANGVPITEAVEHVEGHPEETDYTKISEEPSSLTNVGMRNVETAAKNVQSFLFSREVHKSFLGEDVLVAGNIPEEQHETVANLLSFDKSATLEDVKGMVDLYATKIKELTQGFSFVKNPDGTVGKAGVYTEDDALDMIRDLAETRAFSVGTEEAMIYHIARYVATHPGLARTAEVKSDGTPLEGELLYELDDKGNRKTEPVNPADPKGQHRYVTVNSVDADPKKSYDMDGLAFVDGQILDCRCKVKVAEDGSGAVKKVDPTQKELDDLYEHYRNESMLTGISSKVKAEDIAILGKDIQPTMCHLLGRYAELAKDHPAGFDEAGDSDGTMKVKKPSTSPEFDISLYKSTTFYKEAKQAMLIKLQQHCSYSYGDFSMSYPSDAYVSVSQATEASVATQPVSQNVTQQAEILKTGQEFSFTDGTQISAIVSQEM